ncbi:FHA domain-containing protein [Phormidesmis priestleyi]
MLSHLLLVRDDQGEQQITLEQSLCTIGRDARCTIRLASQFVSRRHATLIQLPLDDGTCRYQIVDGSPKGKPSANGLLINGRKLQTHVLCDRDKIVFGPQVWAVYHLLEGDGLEGGFSGEVDTTLRTDESQSLF